MLDLDMFIRWGQAMQRGEYIGLYPLPFAWIWAALSALPYPVLVFGVLLTSLVLLVVLFRRRALFCMWYAPFVVTIAFGQLTMIWLGLLRLNRWWSWLLLTLKPHWLLFALPSIIAAPRQEQKRFIFSAMALYGLTLFVRPQWPDEWFGALAAEGRVNGDSFSLWGVPVLALAAGLVFLLLRRLPWLTLVTAFNPLVRSYDYMVLADKPNLSLITVSWIALLLNRSTNTLWPYGLIGLWYGIDEWRTNRNTEAKQTTSRRWTRSPGKRTA